MVCVAKFAYKESLWDQGKGLTTCNKLEFVTIVGIFKPDDNEQCSPPAKILDHLDHKRHHDCFMVKRYLFCVQLGSKIGHYMTRQLLLKNLAVNEDTIDHQYTLFQNGLQFSILLFTSKLALVASFKGKYSFEFRV